MHNLVLHRIIHGSEPSAGRRVWPIRIGAHGSAGDIAIPFDVPVIGESAYTVPGAVIQPASHLLLYNFGREFYNNTG